MKQNKTAIEALDRQRARIANGCSDKWRAGFEKDDKTIRQATKQNKGRMI